jgi:cytochrome b561
MSVATRYSPFLVVLHWTVALLVITNLILGGQIADHIADTDPHKLSYLKIHMIIGGTVLVLMVIRLFVRISTPKPPPVSH